MKTAIALSALVLTVFANVSAQARVDHPNESVTRIGAAASDTQSWTVYAPSGRPVTFGPRQSDGRWWPSR
jgi:hypothetical protein